METLGLNYAQDQVDKINLSYENTKEIKASILGLKNLSLMGIATAVLVLVFLGWSTDSTHKQLDRLEDQVTQLSDQVEQDKLDRLSSQIEALRGEVKGDQLQVLTEEIKQLETQLRAAEEIKAEQCALQFFAIKINCQEIR